jgi:hypothetical protein
MYTHNYINIEVLENRNSKPEKPHLLGLRLLLTSLNFFLYYHLAYKNGLQENFKLAYLHILQQACINKRIFIDVILQDTGQKPNLRRILNIIPSTFLMPLK